MAGVDLMMAPSAADDAAEAYFSFLRTKRATLESLLETGRTPQGHSASDLAEPLEDTARSAQEAAKAPSMVRKPFRSDLFSALVTEGRKVAIGVGTIDRAMNPMTDARISDATPRKYASAASPVLEVLKNCKSYKDLMDRMDHILLNTFLLVETSVQATTSLEAVHSTKEVKLKSRPTQDVLKQLVKEISAETDGEFKKTLIPLDQDLDTALQVLVTELHMTVQLCQDIKHHSLTHV
jgi:hypothetical protein